MRNVMVFQHVAHEPLGTLNPLLKSHGLRIRYVNFDRDPQAEPTLDGYNGLIVLGGPMGVYEADRHPHLLYEMRVIEEAFKKDIPVLGICLGAQLMAHVLGASVRKNKVAEVGWYDLNVTAAGATHELFSHFQNAEKIFQLHGDAFEIPRSAVHLASSELCPGQIFSYGRKAFALQCHLEVDEAMIVRWMKRDDNRAMLAATNGGATEDRILADTRNYIERSLALSDETFKKFIALFGLKERPLVLGSGHEKPRSNKR